MRKLVVTALLVAFAAPASALAADRPVAMKFNRLQPPILRALTGDKIVWTNSESVSTTIHNVTSSQFPSSGELAPGQSYEWTFGAPGSFSYVCTHHRGTMTGRVVVADIHLTGPAAALTHGAAGRFTGLAPANEQVVVRAADGAEVGSALAAADGSFQVRVPMIRPGQYHATSGARQSGRVRVVVRPKLALSSKRSGSRLVLTLKATPSQARAPVVVERLQRSRWVRIARGRLNASSKATFRVARKAMRIRARTTRGVAGYATAKSRTLGVR